MVGRGPEGHNADHRKTRMEETCRKERKMEASSEGGQGPEEAVVPWMAGTFCPYLYRMAYNWAANFLVICFVTHNVQVSTDITIMMHYASKQESRPNRMVVGNQ
jgi:hypothetical protein